MIDIKKLLWLSLIAMELTPAMEFGMMVRLVRIAVDFSSLWGSDDAFIQPEVGEKTITTDQISLNKSHLSCCGRHGFKRITLCVFHKLKSWSRRCSTTSYLEIGFICTAPIYGFIKSGCNIALAVWKTHTTSIQELNDTQRNLLILM